MVTRHGNYMIYMVTIREYHTMLTYGLFRIIITIYDMIILMVMFVFDHDASIDDSMINRGSLNGDTLKLQNSW